MMSTIYLDIVSAEGEIFSGPASMVFAPGSEGELGIAPRHAPLLTTLKAGEVRVKTEGHEDYDFFVSGGIIEIQPYAITILADTAERAGDIDEAAAVEAKRRAEEALKQSSSDIDVARAQAEIIEAAARIRAIMRFRSKGHR
ncbi:MAG: F0F1 ATP synthase subunit epsilon [Gammaproteobacteria bacterium]|nr:F0F1 ATP synthase subunit epsilon [Gammaproteobacteria bacterium]